MPLTLFGLAGLVALLQVAIQAGKRRHRVQYNTIQEEKETCSSSH